MNPANTDRGALMEYRMEFWKQNQRHFKNIKYFTQELCNPWSTEDFKTEFSGIPPGSFYLQQGWIQAQGTAKQRPEVFSSQFWKVNAW